MDNIVHENRIWVSEQCVIMIMQYKSLNVAKYSEGETKVLVHIGGYYVYMNPGYRCLDLIEWLKVWLCYNTTELPCITNFNSLCKMRLGTVSLSTRQTDLYFGLKIWNTIGLHQCYSKHIFRPVTFSTSPEFLISGFDASVYLIMFPFVWVIAINPWHF